MRNFTDEELEQVTNKLYKECLDKGMDDDGVVAQPLLYRLARYFLGSFHDRQPP